MHRKCSNGCILRRILVGAPKAKTNTSDVMYGGAIYECMTSSIECPILVFDPNGNEKKMTDKRRLKKKENKNWQWFGATLATSQDHRSVMGCAPRYVYYTKSGNRRLPIGQCFSMSGTGNITRLRPCLDGKFVPNQLTIEFNALSIDASRNTKLHGTHSYCLSGHSASLNKDGTNAVIGAPASYWCQGQLFSLPIPNGQWYNTTVSQRSMKDAKSLYRGFSLSSGHLQGDTRLLDYVSGAPRENGLRGEIEIFSQNMTSIKSIQGVQVGEYFGYSVAVGDFNLDGKDDIVVGCPLYGRRTQYEIGRVFLFYQNDEHKFDVGRTRYIIGSLQAGSRFGLAVAAIGDINKDLYEVGAPYDGEGGAVYIFHGSNEGIRSTPAQKISASSVNIGLRGFGFSISGAYDHDGNGYPDLIVGAYASAHASLLFSRPVIYLKESDLLQFESNVIRLIDRKCSYNGMDVTCITWKTCMVPTQENFTDSTKFWFEFQIDTLKKQLGERAFLYQGVELHSAYNATTSVDMCNNFTMVLDPNNEIKDKLTPIGIELKYGLLHTEPSEWGLKPILSPTSRTQINVQLLIQRDCGEDNVCIPDLAVFLTSQTDSFVFGTEPTIDFNINITNSEEDAYESSFTLFMPRGIQFTRIRKIHGEDTPNCGRIKSEEFLPQGVGAYLKCDIGNPFPANENAVYLLSLRIFKIKETLSELRFMASVNSYLAISSNNEYDNTTFNNRDTFNLTTMSDLDIRLMGNLGPSSAGRVLITIEFPYIVGKLDEGLDLFNFTSPPAIVIGTGSCSLQMVQPKPEITLLAEGVPEAPKKQEESKVPLDGMPMLVNCRSANVQLCAMIECLIDQIDKADQVQVEINLELITSTLQAIQGNFKSVEVKAEAHGVVKNVPYVVQPAQLPNATTQTSINLAGPKNPVIALWMIILAACGGLLLLIVAIVLLWKCGFFHRRRVADVHGKDATRAISSLEEQFSWTGGTEKLGKSENEELN
ncbi:hypothetical protein CAPTEDRAFT_218861 [Capitella teleta]|uniref:Uncharacterized protein n=1 Tax=Capitella teleta TaxID=283909 RepID=R7UV95_CAPTE|nr:hypothetical protein CAPTEDRAFT_218861 [Capitella teleta]|eukprot:ELU10194.1 hypothetical protein CAPTEDRAFT_218861 [Capitella teleta]